MNIAHWLMGPQLIGIVFIIAGYVQKRFPPRKINLFYGYRMPSAMKNQETWDEANQYAARYMLRSGVVLVIAGIIITAILSMIRMERDTLVFICGMLLIPSAIASCVMLIVATEKHLSHKFDNKL